MITSLQRKFQVLAERLLDEVEQCSDKAEAARLGSAANVAVGIAELTRYEAREDYLDEAYRLLSANDLCPEWADVNSASTIRELIRQHVHSAMEDRRAAERAELKQSQR